jgi:multicomponent Na+:H+ antiporter subunit F
MVIIAVLAVKMDEGYLVDICIIYAMISFLAVTLLTKVYMGVYAEHNAKANEIVAKESEEVEVGNDDSATVD